MLAALLLLSAVLLPAQSASRKLIDLTYAFSAEPIYWPNAEGFNLSLNAAGINNKGYSYASNTYSGGE